MTDEQNSLYQEELKPGETYYFTQPTVEGPKRYKLYILAIVYKWFRKHKQRWYYRIEDRDIIKARIRNSLEQ